MKSKKGFTLVELLVVITIIGIITMLALPGVQKIQNRNRNKKYEAYADTIESAGKLYTDAYADDLFGMEGSGCATISYSELKGKSLVKDYEVDGITCDDPGTFVKVERNGEKYKFSVSLNCKKDGKYVYETVPEVEGCSGGAGGNKEIPVIDVTWIQVGPHDDVDTGVPDNGWSKEKDVTIKISAPSGLIDNISIRYGWSTDPNNPPSEDKMYSYNYRNAYGTLEDTFTFHDDGKDEAGNYRNGTWYLYVMGEDVIDVGGHVADNYRSGGIKFDNTAPNVPSLSNGKNNVWAGIEYVQAGSYKVTTNTNDNPTSDRAGVGYYLWCWQSENCSATGYNEWHRYEDSAKNTFTTPSIKEERNEKLLIRACDRADNCSAPSETMVKIDLSAPNCSVTLSGQTQSPTLSDWFYKTAITMNLGKNDTDSTNNESRDATGWYEDKCSNCESGLAKHTLRNSRKTNIKDGSYNSKTSDTQKDTPTSGIIWYGYVEDEAGNITECDSGNFKADVTPPNKPVLDISGSATLTVKMSTSDATTGFAYFESRAANSGAAFTKLCDTNPCTIQTSTTLEIRAVDKADNRSESVFTKHCNISGGTLTFHNNDWYCKRDSYSSTCSSTCSGTCFRNAPCWYTKHGWAHKGTPGYGKVPQRYCSYPYSCSSPCSVPCKKCVEGFTKDSNNVCWKIADGG